MQRTVRYKYRLRPGSVAVRSLLHEWHRTRWVWNQAVDQLNKRQVWVTDKDLTAWRAQHEWLRAGSVVPQQQELRNFRTQRAKGQGRKCFKSAKRTHPSLNYTLRGFSIKDQRLCLPKGVVIPIVWSRALPSIPSSVRVYRDSVGHWYASFVVQRDDDSTMPPTSSDAIGIDWGLKQVATTTKPEYDLPHERYAERAAQRLKKYQRRMARRKPAPGKRASNGYKAAKRQAARQHKRVAAQRLDAARKWASRVVRDHGYIAVEDFKPKFMMKSRAARSAADAGIGITKRTLIELAERHGREVRLVDPAFTTMDCSACHARTKQRLSLSERTFRCSCCATVIDRDLNAARNVLHRAGFHPATVDVFKRDAPLGVSAD